MKMKFSELKRMMMDFNKKHGIERKVCTKYTDDGRLIEMTGKVVIKSELLNRPDYTEEQRTYTFSNYNKALTSGDSGYSIFAYCSDGDNMRIEYSSDNDFELAEVVSIVE